MSRIKFEYDRRTAYSRRKTYGAWILVRDARQILASVLHRSDRPDGSGQLIHPEVSVMQTRVYRTGEAGHKVGEQGSYDHWVLVKCHCASYNTVCLPHEIRGRFTTCRILGSTASCNTTNDHWRDFPLSHFQTDDLCYRTLDWFYSRSSSQSLDL